MFTLNYNPIKKELNASDIKLIAIITMLIDHIGAVIIEGAMKIVNHSSSAYKILDILDQIFRSVGRLAFPIFVFFIAVGYMHTSNKWKYLLRLFIFGLISEVPFDLAFANKLFYPGYQNVYFTLSLGLLAIIGRDALKKVKFNETVAVVLRHISFFIFGMMFFYMIVTSGFYKHFMGQISILFFNTRKIGSYLVSVPSSFFYFFAFASGVISSIFFTLYTAKKPSDKVNKEAISWFVPFFCMLVAQIAATDYGAKGVAIAVVAYAFLEMTQFNNDALIYSVIAIGIFNPGELCALLDVFFIDKYNGKKGDMNKYLFYLFYPVHLLILGLIARFFLIP